MRRILLLVSLMATLVDAPPGVAQDELPAGFDRATITALVWDLASPNRIYAGTMGWGLVVSEDGGRTWSATATELGGRHIQSIAVHPLLPDRLLVGTAGAGVWLSSDGGRSFRSLGEDLPESDIPGVSIAVEIDPEIDEARWRRYEARMRLSGREPHLSKRIVGGAPALWVALRIRGPVRIGRGPTDRALIIARMQPFHDVSAHLVRPAELLVAGRGVVAHTEDGGETWTPSLNPDRFRESPHFLRGADPASCFRAPTRIHRQALDPEQVWVAACYGLFHSPDGGESWNILPLSGFGRILAVAADPGDAATLAASTDLGLLRSRDGGATWDLLRAAAPGAPFRAVAVMRGGRVLAGGFGGEVVEVDEIGIVDVRRLRQLQVTQTPDPEERALRLARSSTAPYDRAGLAARPEADPRLRAGIDVHVADIEPHPNVSDRLFAGTRRGIFLSEDGGETWRSSSLGLGELEVADVLVDGSAALLDTADPDPAGERIMLWAATRGGGVYRSTSTAKAWQPASQGLLDGNVRVLLQDDFQPHVLWAGTADDGVYRSSDAGESWTSVNLGLGEYGVRALVQTAGILLAATDNGDLYESFDDGDSWRKRAGGLRRNPAESEQDLQAFTKLGVDPRRMHVHDLLADPSDPDRLIAASTFGVFLTEDGGASWTWTRLRRSVARLARDPFDDQEIYAATTRGLWFSKDGGESWEQADFGRALNDLDLRGDGVDPTKTVRVVPPLFALTVLAGGDVVAGTDRGQVVRGSVAYGGWRVGELANPLEVARPVAGPAPREPRPVPEVRDLERIAELRARRDGVLLASALGADVSRRKMSPRRAALLALEARRRGEVPEYPQEILDRLAPPMREELLKEDMATRVLRLADADLRALQTALVDGWGVDDLRFGPSGRYLAVQSSVDDGRRSRSEIRIFDLERRFLQGEEVYPRQGPTPYWKVLHDLARKPQAAHPDWLLEDTGLVLHWQRSEVLVTRPMEDRLAIWRLGPRPWGPAPASEVQAGTIQGFPLPVGAVSISADGKWLGAVDSSGSAFWVLLSASREPERIEIPVPGRQGADGDEPPAFHAVHVTPRQILLLGDSGIVAYRLAAEGPILTTPEGEDAGELIFGPSAGFSEVVADRDGDWIMALPAASEETQSLVFVAFRDGLATKALELDDASDSSWRATVSAQQDWLAVHRSARDDSETALYDMRGSLQESGPQLFFRVEDARDLRFAADGEHVFFRAEAQEQVWTLGGSSPKQLLVGTPDLGELERGFSDENAVALAGWFFAGEPRMGDMDSWSPPGRHAVLADASPDGRWLAVSGPGRALKLWHFAHDWGSLAPWTGTTLLDLSRFRPYPSSYPSNLDVRPVVEPRQTPPGSGELWQQACSIAGRNLDQAEWTYLFGEEEEWQPTCRFE